ncbi:MAG TPA: glycosyltransferase [Geminicoccaceae bacterium]
MSRSLDIVVIGLSITSSWGNGHATTFRSLIKGLDRLGHEVLFLERDVPWYADNRDLPDPPFGRTRLYRSLDELRETHEKAVADADLVVLGSYVPDGIEIARWLTATVSGTVAFYDIDTPVTLRALERGGCGYLEPGAIPCFDLYLSFAGGPTLTRLERDFGARRARALYCSVDPDLYRRAPTMPALDLGYLGTYSADRQPKLDALLLEPARAWPGGRFVVAGPQYPPHVVWPENVARIEHLAPDRHPGFYGAQRFTLNITRADMVASGFAPSVRLFEAAACGTPVISDRWAGLDELFRDGRELLIADDGEAVLRHLRTTGEVERLALAEAARRRVLAAHTGACRAGELVEMVREVESAGAGRPALAPLDARP